MKSLKNSLLLYAICFCTLAIQPATAQPPSPPANPAAVPIDGGLGLLLAAGMGLGARTAWKKRKGQSK